MDIWRILERIVLVATLAVAILALLWAHRDSAEQADVLDKSRAALDAVLQGVRAETPALENVSGKLNTANGALDRLQRHTQATVVELQQADVALRDVLATSRNLSGVDRGILNVSAGELRLLTSEHADRVARENAAPKISIELMVDSGDEQRFYPPPPNGWNGRVIVGQRQGSAAPSFGLVLTNTGTAMAESPTVLIQAPDGLGIGGCPSIFPHRIQCGAPDVLIGGYSLIKFNVGTPPTAKTYWISAVVLTKNAAGVLKTFTQSFPLYLGPK